MKGLMFFLQVVIAILDAVVAMEKAARRETLEDIRIRNERTKNDLLQKKIQTEDARAHQVNNNAVLTDLKIEKARRELGMDVPEFKPSNYDQ